MERVPLDHIQLPDWGWHYDDDVQETAKLTASLQRYGQLAALVVRQVQNLDINNNFAVEVIDGRRRLSIMRQLGWAECWVLNRGSMSDVDAIALSLSLELSSEIDYAKLARLLSTLDDTDSLAMVSPLTAERIDYLRRLVTFDWSMYDSIGTEQAVLFEDDDAPPPPPPVPEVDTSIQQGKTIVVKTPKAVKTTAQPPASAAIEAARRLAARRAVLGAGPLIAPVAEQARDVGLRQEIEEVVAHEVSLTDGGRNEPEVVQGWRPDALPCLEGVKEVELDCETNGLKWWEGHRPIGLALRLPDGQKFYFPWGHAGGNLPEEQVKRWARDELRGLTITNLNTRFDNHMMREWGVDLEAQGCRLADVAHYAALIDEYTREFNLDALSKQYLGQQKVEGLDKTRMASYHASQVADYAKQDVHLVAGLKAATWPIMDAQELHRVRVIEEDLIYPVCEMERNAAHIDRNRLREITEQSAHELQDLLFDIARETGFQMNPDKNADWVKFFEHLRIPLTNFTAPSKKFPQGQPSFPDAYLARFDHPLIKGGRRAGKLASLRSKFLTSYMDVVGDDCNLRFALHQLRGDEYGTVRGRFSMSGSSKGIGQFGANLQQVFSAEKQRESFGFDGDDASHDHEIYLVRQIFMPDRSEDALSYMCALWPGGLPEGFTPQYLAADAQAIEYRLAAHFAASDKLIAAYKENPWVDFHKVVMDFVTPYKKIGRKTTKNLNFCKIYGGGRDTVARTLGMERVESDQIVAIYDRTFPEFAELLKKASSLMRHRGFVRTLAGRRARLQKWIDVDAYGNPKPMDNAHAALNYVIQGSAADIMKLKLVELHRERKTTGFLMRQTVHDEVDGDMLHPETPKRVAEILNVQSFDTKVPILWQVKTGDNWSQC